MGSSAHPRFARGAVVGTGANIDIRTLGFVPGLVKLWNVDGNCFGMWSDKMAAASAQKVVDSGSGATDISKITSGGVSQLAADGAGNSGFRIGTDSDLNASGETIVWEAWE
jgi:hypothetical protein